MHMVPNETIVVDRASGVENAVHSDAGPRVHNGAGHEDGTRTYETSIGHDGCRMYNGQWDSPAYKKSFENGGASAIVADPDHKAEGNKGQPSAVRRRNDLHAIQGIATRVIVHDPSCLSSRTCQGVQHDPSMPAGTVEDQRVRNLG